MVEVEESTPTALTIAEYTHESNGVSKAQGLEAGGIKQKRPLIVYRVLFCSPGLNQKRIQMHFLYIQKSQYGGEVKLLTPSNVTYSMTQMEMRINQLLKQSPSFSSTTSLIHGKQQMMK